VSNADREADYALHSYEYAWAMGSACEGGKGHPRIAAVRERVEDLRALIEEHEV
jgi:hypothetical protein